jgi:hypothetical protein
MLMGKQLLMLWRSTMPPSSGLRSPLFLGLFDPKMKALHLCEMSVIVYQLTCHNIQGSLDLHQQCLRDLQLCSIADV